MQTTAIVVGAGVAGLQTARALLKHGFSVTVLEQSGEVGGVWSRNYAHFGLQGNVSCM
jgi:dimethylaniline monooxygenase (N-oxide forming)